MATEAIRPAQNSSTPPRLESKPKEVKPEPTEKSASVKQDSEGEKRKIAEA